MKNIKITLSIIGIIIVSSILVVIIKNNTKEYIMYEGSMLALTVDGAPATSFPSNTNKYHVDIECEDGVGQYLPIKEDGYNAKFIVSNITKTGVKCNIDFTTITDSNKNNYLASSIIKNTAVKTTTTNYSGGTDTSYRYIGSTPNNYVWFNDEMWRIIGLIPVCLTSGCGTPSTSLVKIIRADSIGTYSYDAKTSPTGAWGNNTLKTLLNSYYYGKVNGNGTSYCYKYYSSSYKPVSNCDFRTIGISSTSTDYYGKMIEKVYWNTGESYYKSTTPEVYKTETAEQSIYGYIGLLAASDYGYAGNDLEVVLYNAKHDALKNWLYYENEYTLVQDNKDLNIAFNISIAGRVDSNGSAADGHSVRPVVYLDSSVYIISGEGTETNPYILGM